MESAWAAIHHDSVSGGYPGDSAVGLCGRKIASELGVPASSVFNELRRINQESQEVERLEVW